MVVQNTCCLFVCLVFFVCLFVCFHSYGDVTIAGEGLQILSYVWHSWSLNSEGKTKTLVNVHVVFQNIFKIQKVLAYCYHLKEMSIILTEKYSLHFWFTTDRKNEVACILDIQKHTFWCVYLTSLQSTICLCFHVFTKYLKMIQN